MIRYQLLAISVLTAVTRSAGRRRAMLAGVVRWERAEMGGRNPALYVDQVISIADHDADWSELS